MAPSRSTQDQERLLSSDPSTQDSYAQNPYQPRPRPWQHGIPWILTTLFAFTTIILAVQLARGDHYQHTGDVNGIAPRFDQKIVTFQPSKEATASIGHPDQKEATNEFWQTFAPDGFGLVNLRDYSKQRYPHLAPPTEADGGYNLVDTSMAHQLHCLHSIMEAYNDLALSANKTGSHMAMGHEHHDTHLRPHILHPTRSPDGEKLHHHDHSWHLGHCFDYIRQGIMCCGDTALEGAATTFPEGLKGSDGWNAKHVCKDYGQVKDWIVGMGPGKNPP